MPKKKGSGSANSTNTVEAGFSLSWDNSSLAPAQINRIMKTRIGGYRLHWYKNRIQTGSYIVWDVKSKSMLPEESPGFVPERYGTVMVHINWVIYLLGRLHQDLHSISLKQKKPATKQMQSWIANLARYFSYHKKCRDIIFAECLKCANDLIQTTQNLDELAVEDMWENTTINSASEWLTKTAYVLHDAMPKELIKNERIIKENIFDPDVHDRLGPCVFL